jgi:WhiB family redox-sensing transcriptional regulator
MKPQPAPNDAPRDSLGRLLIARLMIRIGAALPGEWADDAACDMSTADTFYPDKYDGGDTRPAKRICAVCAVQAECLDFALKTDQRLGVWGGTSPSDREKLRRKGNAA